MSQIDDSFVLLYAIQGAARIIEINMKDSNCIRLFIYLFITGIHTRTAYSYGDPEFNHNDFNLNESTQSNLENLNETSQDRHRAKRAVGDSATTMDPYTSK
ncbi:unnamed protein product [Rotaria magnacalcarata]|uniref:Uncharacterized protein n=1 Tax=Rotaria magnacalcarata TaxID=392030 RepID=A0A8S2NXR3_9BILA|nr:unnamed protein product [Rotaria magnacalcarata]